MSLIMDLSVEQNLSIKDMEIQNLEVRQGDEARGWLGDNDGRGSDNIEDGMWGLHAALIALGARAWALRSRGVDFFHTDWNSVQ